MTVTGSAQTAVENGTVELKTVIIEKSGHTPFSQPTVLTDRQTAADITRKQVDNVEDIGRLDPVIGYNSRNNSFTIRGLDAGRILTTIDGIRVPWLDDGARGIKGGTSTFDFNALSALDIIRGSDSSLYGSGALGGVVALRTLDPEDLLAAGDRNRAAITKGAYDSADRSWRIDQAFALRADQTYVLFQGGYAAGKQRRNNGSGGGYGFERILENPADYDQNNLLFKIYRYLDGGHRFGFTAERYAHDKDVLTLNASTGIYRPGSATNEEKRQRTRVSLSYDYNGNGDAFLDEAHAILYWQRQQLEQISRGWRIVMPEGLYMRDNTLRMTGYGMQFNGLKRLDLNGISHTVRFDTDLSAGRFHQYSAGEDTCPPPPYTGRFMGCAFLHSNHSDAPDTDSKRFGFALEDEIGFMDDRLRITPGARFDWYDHKPKPTRDYEQNPGFAGYPRSSSASRLSPKLRAEWNATDQVIFYARWAQSFRAPSVTELYLDYVTPNRYYSKGNPDLKPESGNGYDIGARLGDDYLGGSISLFSNHYRNFIDVMELGRSGDFPMGRKRYVNRHRVRISGFELKGHWLLGNGWHVRSALVYAQGRDIDRNEYLDSVPPMKGVIGVGYRRETWGADVTMTAAARRDKVAKIAAAARGGGPAPRPGFAIAPGYAVFDLTGWWQPFGEKGIRVQAGIYNLFNKLYWNAVDLPSSSAFGKDYFSEPGRTFKISFVQKF